jgi:flagellar basal-body rod modification protein FlgD
LNITPLTASSKTQDSSALTSNQKELSDQFLRLLTTQLENQDPLDPLDGNQFIDQLATISSLEQQVEMNRQLGELVAMMREGDQPEG